MTAETSQNGTPHLARRGCWLLTALLVVSVAGAAGWWWWSRPAPPEPPLPPNIEDAEVRQVIERARQEVLAKPRDGDAWGRLGMMLLAHLFDREADRCFAEAARLKPSEPRWPYARGLIALKRDPDNAVPFLRQAVAAPDATADLRSALRMQLAEALLARRELDEAERLFREELASAPRDARASFGLGLVLLARGNDKDATDYMLVARESNFARKKAMAQLAALAGARNDTAAATAYEKEMSTLADDPPWPDPMFDQIVQLQVGHRSWDREVAELENTHKYADAAKLYLDHMGERPNSRDCVGAGLNLARLHDYDRALPLLRQGVQLDPDSSQAHYTLALAQFTRAERDLAQHPDSEAARDWLREVIEHARRTVELKLDFAQAYLFWGLALKYLGEPAAAVDPLRRGVSCRPEDFDLQLALGQVLLATGQDKLAETYLENARRLNPDDPRPAQDLQRLHKKPN